MFPSMSERFIKQQKFTQEDQHLYNHHIIENFVESVREMNGAVLIPSRLRDLEPNTTTTLNDDLYQYYRMINTVKNDLFEPHHHEEVNNSIFTPKRKISRIQRKEDLVIPSRKLSQSSMSSVSSFTDLVSLSQETESNGKRFQETDSEFTRQNSTQLTDQFIHHLHSLYGILEHFTHAADYITERYIEEVESVA